MGLNLLDFCVIKRIFRFPCPGCGMTRAWISVVKLDFETALYYHPLFWTVPVFVILIIFYMRRTKKWNKIAIVLMCMLYIAVYIIRIANGWRG